MSNAVLEQIQQVLGNLVQTFNIYQTYIDKDDPWLGTLSEAKFEIRSKTNMKKCYIPCQLIFYRDMILPIKHTVNWELVRHQRQTQVNKDNIRENRHIVEHDYKVGDNSMLTKNTAYKYQIPYTGPFVITQCLPMER